MKYSFVGLLICWRLLSHVGAEESHSYDHGSSSIDSDIPACECGLKHRLISRIIGGERNDIKDFPWMVGITVMDNIICGGALISKRYALTAAHCFKDPAINKLAKVRLGATRRDESVADSTIEQIIVNENYQKTRPGFYDIALIELAEAITFNSRVYPICLPDQNGNFEDEWAIVAGWGVTKHDGAVSNYLRSALVPIIPLSECAAIFEKANKSVTENNVCAGGQKKQDACQGDSGSPLFVEKDGVFKVIGIVSWGIGCASTYPGVYTNVAYYLPWINQHFKRSCDMNA